MAIPSQTVISNATYGRAIAEGRNSLLDRMQYFGTPGLSVAVSIRNEVVWVECFGYSDIERKIRVNPTTKFRVASVSKSFTAGLMATLQEDGKVAWDVPISTYLVDFPEKKHPFTIRQLAGHLSGVDYSKPLLNKKRYDSINESLQEFETDPLLFPPGARFHYSNNGYTILSAIAEAVSDRDYLSLMDERVFKPLLMTNTCADQPGVSNVTVFYDNYTKQDHLPVIAPYHDSSRLWAAGGFLSTPLDMIKFGNAHLSGEFLNPSTITTLHTSQTTTDGKETGYGIGWKVVGSREVRHLGDTVGSQAFLVLRPESDLVIAMVCTGNFWGNPWNYYGDGTSGSTDRLARSFVRAIEKQREAERAKL